MKYKGVEVLEKQEYGSLRFGICKYGFRLKNNYHNTDANWYHYLSDIDNCKCGKKSS